MRFDFQLKALGHWSHLYSLSSEWVRIWASRLQETENKTTMRISSVVFVSYYMLLDSSCSPHESTEYIMWLSDWQCLLFTYLWASGKTWSHSLHSWSPCDIRRGRRSWGSWAFRSLSPPRHTRQCKMKLYRQQQIYIKLEKHSKIKCCCGILTTEWLRTLVAVVILHSLPSFPFCLPLYCSKCQKKWQTFGLPCTLDLLQPAGTAC